MMFPSHPSSVPLFHPLESGTVEQDQVMRNTQWNTAGTISLKALANKVLERNKERNKYGTMVLKPVPHSDQTVPLPGTNPESDCATRYDTLSYEFEERAAIMEYDGGLTRKEAERLARIDTEENQKDAAP